MQIHKKTVENFQHYVLENNATTTYLLVGSEILFITETIDIITAHLQKIKKATKYKWVVDNKTNWNDILNEIQEIGLFADTKIIYLILPETLTKDIQEKLVSLVSVLHDDIVLIIHLIKFNKTTEQHQWINNLLAKTAICLIDCNTIAQNQLKNWIKSRSQALDLKLEQEAVNVLMYAYEGNLLALKQTLEFLKLLYPNSEVTAKRVEEIAEQSAVFKPYTWIDALFLGKIDRAIRILSSLKQEDIAPIILLRTIQKELQIIFDILISYTPATLDETFPFGNFKYECDRLKIWQARRAVYSELIARLTYKNMYEIWEKLMEIEKSIKINFSGQEWTLLEKLSLKFI